MLYKDAIAKTMVDALRGNERVVIIGQNVTTQHGVFGTTSEAARLFPKRVLEAPVSETMLTGACVGLALEGYRPILVHTRADFSLFSFEHLINTAAKFRFLHGKPLPFVMRCVVGRGWGQGPVHSQSWHHMLAQIPGLKVYMPVFPSSYQFFCDDALMSGFPCIIFESRRLYETSLERQQGSPVDTMMGLADITFFTYGDGAIDAYEAARTLAKVGIIAYVCTQEDVSASYPLGSKPSLTIDVAPRRPERGVVAPPFMSLGVAAPYEQTWYPTARDIVEAACKMLGKGVPPRQKEAHERDAVGITSAF